MEKAVADAKSAEKRLKEEELRAMEEDCNQKIASKTQRL